MDPGKRHRYTSAMVAATLLIVFGGIIVFNRAGNLSSGNSSGIDINGVLQTTDSAMPMQDNPQPTRPTPVTLPYTDVLATGTATNAASDAQTQTQTPDSSFSWDSFVTALTHASASASAPSKGSDLASQAYSFIPSGLFSPPQPKSALDVPDAQKPLYQWGESAGEVILAYENDHPNQPQILTDYMQDRQNPVKIAAMKKLGADLVAVGDDLGNVDPTPPQIATASAALADAYRTIGHNLAAIPDAAGDSATVKAIETYDSSAEAFVKKYVNVVNILQANGIKYAQSEPGGVFMFPSQ